MVGMRRNTIAASIMVLGTLGVPAIASAQGYRYLDNGRQSVVVKCAPGQRATMVQRQAYGGSQLVARCSGSRLVNDGYGRPIYARQAQYGRYDTYRPATERRYYYAPRRSKAKSALVIAGSAATGAGIGGAIGGKAGALIGAAIGGGGATIYEGARRR